ncbi:phage tail-collar fiber domain-containing protein [Pseudomonas reactans]
MGARITLAGENLIAQRQAVGTGLKVSRFIFANVPGLNPNTPVDRAAPKPVAAQIVYVHEIPTEHAGYVNPNQVVYIAQIGSDVGDWDFNWIGLETVDGVLFAVAYVPTQQKRRNIPPQQIGNNLTRNMLLVFDGAQGLTGITIDAKTWQHDFTVRLAGIDERARKASRDLYGRRLCLNSGLLMEKVGNAYQLKPGVAYVEGLRIELAAALPVAAPPSYPINVWLDVSLQRQLNDVVVIYQVAYASVRPDYVDSNGVTHYNVLLAEFTNANTLVDRRIVIETSGALLADFALKKGDYPELRARGTKKDDVGLGNIPNAISDDPASDSSDVLASTKMVAAVKQQLNTEIGKKANKADVFTKPESDERFVRMGGVWNYGTNFAVGSLPTLAAAGNYEHTHASICISNAGVAAAPAAIAFLRGGSYGTFFGLDTDNQFAFGGWSAGNKRYRFWTEANFNPDSKANNVQATEEIYGIARVATQQQADAGADDNAFITSKKLRWGFALQLAANGYIVFPTWLGGLIWQWGTAQPSANTLSFPIAFPNACLMLGGTAQGDANSGSANTEWMVIANVVSKSQFRLRTGTANLMPVKWHAIGY